MANINLLPWREAQRRERNRNTLMICVAMWIGAGLIVLAAKTFMDLRIGHQEKRNAYIQSEIDALSKVIAEIEDLKRKKDQLIARMEVIQNLQRNRSQVVHVFDDLVSKQPEGIYYDSIEKNDGKLKLRGKAQSNNRVSSLMRSLDSSEWLAVADLRNVDVQEVNNGAVSVFDLEVSEQSPNQDAENE